MIYTIEKIASIVDGNLLMKDYNNLVVKELLFDSRLLISAENTLFFSLKSSRNNGDKYIEDLYDKGVRAFVVEDSPYIRDFYETKNDAAFVVVGSTLKALQDIATYHRTKFNIPIIGLVSRC